MGLLIFFIVMAILFIILAVLERRSADVAAAYKLANSEEWLTEDIKAAIDHFSKSEDDAYEEVF